MSDITELKRSERRLYIGLALFVAAVSALAGWLGFQLGNSPSRTIIVHIDQPLVRP